MEHWNLPNGVQEPLQQYMYTLWLQIRVQNIMKRCGYNMLRNGHFTIACGTGSLQFRTQSAL